MARGFDDLHKVFIVQRSKGNDDHYGYHKRTSSESSALVKEILGGLGQGHENQIKGVDPNNKRYRDICFGSPYRKVKYW